MTESARPLIRDLTNLLWPLLETEGDREEWLDVALIDLAELRGDIDWSGSPRRFTRRLVSELLTRQGETGRRGLLNLLDDIADQKGVDWSPHLQPLRARVAGFTARTEPEIAPPPPVLLELRDRLLGQDAPADLDLTEETVQTILRYRPRDLTDYRVARMAEWSQPRFALDKRFVQLALLLDQGEEAQGVRFVEQRDGKFQDLGEVLAAVPDPALVVLGAPGSGKSTLLRRFELDTARAVLAESQYDPTLETPLTFFMPLNTYRSEHPDEPLPSPRDWLCRRWADRYPGLPPLDELLETGRITLLLDALNEIPQPGDEPIRRWKAFLAELHQTQPGNRVIFSCRSLDYSASLSSTEQPVPQVRIKSLSNEQVQQFLTLYCPRYAATLWDNLQDTPQLELLRTPYYLKLLVEMTTEGEVPEGRAALFTGFVRRALVREVRGDNPLFRPNELLKQRDCRRLEQVRRWKTPYDLPTRGILIAKLCLLAHAMQERHSEQETAGIQNTGTDTYKAGEASQVRIGLDDALDILDHPHDEDILKAGEALGVLDEDDDNEEVLYRHQLLQEYFAARILAGQPEPERVQVAWAVGKTSPSLEEILARIADADPLPPLPATGWEETTVLAAAMTANADAFVAALKAVNLPLAGRCAAQPDVAVSATLKSELQQALIGRTRDPNADLRARIAAGLALGELGDPRFEHRMGPDGDYLMPPLAPIPGDVYTLGSDEGLYNDEGPVHTVELAPFLMGQFPVMNAEWRLFMKAGGYKDERWWVTAEDKAWRRGELRAEGTKWQLRKIRKTLQNNFDSIRNLHREGRITSKQADDYEQIARTTKDEFEDLLDEWYPSVRQTQPIAWNDGAFNNPNQPVVGLSWYEARAYCAWLSAQTGQTFRLSTEAEWETAARGRRGRRLAYGNDFDAACCNTFETHIRRTTPVGVFPGGETPDTGLVDMTGNVWEWTSSLYRPYPYDPADGRENPLTDDGRRVVRGGSWFDNQVSARATSRDGLYPGYRYDSQGFRVVCSSPIF